MDYKEKETQNLKKVFKKIMSLTIDALPTSERYNYGKVFNEICNSLFYSPSNSNSEK